MICRKGLEAVDVQRGGYASWRAKYHQFLLNEEDHYFGLESALILAAAVGVKVDITAL